MVALTLFINLLFFISHVAKNTYLSKEDLQMWKRKGKEYSESRGKKKENSFAKNGGANTFHQFAIFYKSFCQQYIISKKDSNKWKRKERKTQRKKG